MPVQFHKMHGAGNDFVVLDFRHSDQQLNAQLAARLSDRRLGVGCDQILVLNTSEQESCAARYRIYNSDGSSAGQCGNGVRAIALYFLRRGEFGSGDQPNQNQVESLLRLKVLQASSKSGFARTANLSVPWANLYSVLLMFRSKFPVTWLA